jgi:outer membrane protein assembly factor BamB
MGGNVVVDQSVKTGSTHEYIIALVSQEAESMAKQNVIFVGIKGTVVALDRATGEVLWMNELKGGDFVNLVVDDDYLYATTRGEIFCLDPATGALRWHNRLKGLGYGLVTMATTSGGQIASMAEKRRRDQAAAAAAASSAS